MRIQGLKSPGSSDQGKLTDAAGNPLPNGTYGVAFRVWNKKAATDSGNQFVWGQEYSVAVQNGVFNVILGAPGGMPLAGAAVNDLTFAFTEADRFFGLTVTRGTNGASIAGATEIIPRQQVLSGAYAFSALKAQSASQADMAQSLTSLIQATNMADRAITSGKIADGSIAFPKLSSREIGANVGVGGVAISSRSDGGTSSGAVQPIANLAVSIRTTGRPVTAWLMPADGTSDSNIGLWANTSAVSYVYLVRDGQTQLSYVLMHTPSATDLRMIYPTSAVSFLDLPPPGTHSYSISAMARSGSNNSIQFQNVKLVVFEL